MPVSLMAAFRRYLAVVSQNRQQFSSLRRVAEISRERTGREGILMGTLACRVIAFATIFFASIAGLYFAWAGAPDASSTGVPKPRHIPRSLEDLQGVAVFLGGYRDEHYTYTMFLFSFAYLFKQAFAIPGSFFMNLLAGALFGRGLGSALVCPLTAAGATLCYLLSASFARPLVEKAFRKRIRTLRDTEKEEDALLEMITSSLAMSANALKDAVHENEHRLFYFLLCARFFPFTPHWLLNICSPFIDIRPGQFALSVLIGLAPYNILCVHAGCTLAQLKTVSEVIDAWVLLQLAVVAVAMGAMGFYSKKRNSKMPEMVR